MRASFIVALTLSVSLLSPIAILQANEPPRSSPELRASALNRPDEYIFLEYRVWGCFGMGHYRLRYEPQPSPRLIVWDGRQIWKKDARGKEYVSVERFKLMATVTLDAQSLELLDNLLTCYGDVGKDSGLIVSTATAKHYIKGKPVITRMSRNPALRTEVRGDADSRDLKTLSISAPPVLDLEQAVRLARIGQRKGQAVVPYTSAPRVDTYAYILARQHEAILADQREGARLLPTLNGLSRLEKEFHVSGPIVGRSGPITDRATYGDEWLTVDLTAKRPRLLNVSHWTNPITDGTLKYTADAYLTLHERLEAIITPHRWLSQWKLQEAGRSVEANVFALNPVRSWTDRYTTDAISTWKEAKLAGSPQYHITLRRPNDTRLEVYFSKDEKRALILSSDLPKSKKVSSYPLDRLSVFYYSREPGDLRYAVLSPEGKILRSLKHAQ